MSEIVRNLDEFNRLQDTLQGQLYAPDRVDEIVTNTNSDIFTKYKITGQDFYDVSFTPQELLRSNGQFSQLIGRVVLFPNRRIGAFSPGIVQPVQDGLRLTILDQPFDPTIGLSEGQHFGLSAEAQTRAPSFGEHGVGKFEAGHFGTVLVAARSERIANSISTLGDGATHSVLESGLTTVMTAHDMLPLAYRHSEAPATAKKRITALWHPALEGEDGPMQADYTHAIKVVLGAGVAAVGRRGVEQARRLADDAFRR